MVKPPSNFFYFFWRPKPPHHRRRSRIEFLLFSSSANTTKKNGIVVFFMCVSRLFGSVSRSGRLFVVGRSSLLGSAFAGRRFSFAGSRRGLSPESVSWLRSQVARLSPDRHVLVSGGAVGADTIAHRAALERGVPQIVVLPGGFDRPYPRSNLALFRSVLASGGCLVSLLPPSVAPSRSSFVKRNEVIARLGASLLVPQCAARSGTMHTVRFARGAGVPVLFRRGGAPHLVGVPGCSPI